MPDKRPKYIPGTGWRYDIEHNHKRRLHGHNYSDRGTYLITIVVEDRRPVFGTITGNVDAPPHSSNYPTVAYTPLGRTVIHDELPKIHKLYPMAEVWQACIMPDHIHLIIHINGPLPPKKHLGTIVGAFKGGISRAWRASAPNDSGYNNSNPSLFEDNYNDRVLMRSGQLENWKTYLLANPFRRLLMTVRPEVMKRSLCLVINGIRYGAFGNFLLLRHPEKVQVFFHRKMPDDRLTPAAQNTATTVTPTATTAPLCVGRQPGGSAAFIPTELTTFWQHEHTRLIDTALQGDVIVTPGISECEKRIKNECLEQHLRLIHIQAHPIGPLWKPEKARFNACAAGTLLILAPWHEDLHLRDDSAYECFHNLNEVAASICSLSNNASCTMKQL
ncbi:MAG: transposase [Bacteroidales bacterium]|nr:transposase [Bacteroidales bacterium]